MSDHSDHGWFREQVFVNLRRPVLISYDGGILTVIMINTAWEHKKAEDSVTRPLFPQHACGIRLDLFSMGKLHQFVILSTRVINHAKKNYEF